MQSAEVLLGQLLVGAADEALHGIDGVLGVGGLLVEGRGADDALAVLGVRHDGRGGALAVGIHDDGGLVVLEDAHARVGRAEVDTDNLGHVEALLSSSVSSPTWRRPLNDFVGNTL